MRKYEETTVQSVEELVIEVPPLRGTLQSNYYRGHARGDWELRPALFRVNLEKTASRTWLELAHSRGLRFKQLAPSELRQQLQSELEWIATACHHEAPTHFSAWSEAALVAAYFATEETPDKANGALWRLMPGCDELTIFQDYEQVPDAPRLYHPHYQTAEMAAQRVCFLSHPFPEGDMPPVSFENYYQASEEAMNLTKIIIPHSAKNSIRRQLAALGVDARSLFPGLRGIGRQISHEIYSHTDSYDWIMNP